MIIPDNIIKEYLKNVYFIWGSGKTVTANALAQKHNFYVYHTDDSREKHFKNAQPELQSAMCRDVPDFWALEANDAVSWERAIVKEMTPMIIADLISLCARYDRIICEGDIDIDLVLPVVTNAITISNHGASYDFFNRPEQSKMLEAIKKRTDIDGEEKQKIIENAYRIIKSDLKEKENDFRKELLYGVKEIIRDDSTGVDDVVRMIEEYWQLN